MAEIIPLGNININLLEKEFEQLSTSETVVTNERLSHINERHPEDFELFKMYGAESIQYPDII